MHQNGQLSGRLRSSATDVPLVVLIPVLHKSTCNYGNQGIRVLFVGHHRKLVLFYEFPTIQNCFPEPNDDFTLNRKFWSERSIFFHHRHMWAQCSAFAVPFPHLDLALPTSLSFLSLTLPVLSPFLCSRCIPVGPRREERISAGGAASRRREALRSGGGGRHGGDGLAAGGAAALAPGAAPADLVFFIFSFFNSFFI